MPSDIMQPSARDVPTCLHMRQPRVLEAYNEIEFVEECVAEEGGGRTLERFGFSPLVFVSPRNAHRKHVQARDQTEQPRL